MQDNLREVLQTEAGKQTIREIIRWSKVLDNSPVENGEQALSRDGQRTIGIALINQVIEIDKSYLTDIL